MCRSSAIDVCWRQWRALGALVSPISKRSPRSIIDPEALVLLSVTVREQERRLSDVIQWWATVGSSFVSVQRLQSMRAKLSRDLTSDVSVFAHLAYQHGDRRWKRFAGESPVALASRLKGSSKPALIAPAALLLRLRAAFGVNVKSDLLTLLLGATGSVMVVKRMAEALNYSVMAISAAAREMADAGILIQTSERPVGYFVDSPYWEKLLNLSPRSESVSSNAEHTRLPVWRFWWHLFAFLIDVLDWSDRRGPNKSDTYVLSSQARDLYYAHENAFALNGIPVPNPSSYKGEEYLDVFLLTLRSVSNWMDRNF